MPSTRTPLREALTRGIGRNVVALAIVSLLTDVSSEMLVYVIPLFLANVLAASPSIIGVIEGVAESAAALLKLASGWMSDRIARRRLLVGIGYGGSVAAKALYVVAGSWPVVLLARLGDRVGKGIRTAPRDALIADSTPPEARGVAFGFHRALDTTGAVLGVAIAAIVVAASQGGATSLDEATFRTLALVALVPGVLAVAAIVVGVHDVPRRQAADGRRPAPGVADGRVVGRWAGWRRFPMPFWLFVVASGLFALGNSSDAFLALRSQQLGLDVRDLLLVVIAFNVTNAAIAWPVGALSDRVGRVGLLIASWLIYAVSYAGFAMIGAGGPIAGLWIVYGAYYGVSDAVGRAFVADVAPADMRATGYGIVNAVVGILVLPASVIAGLLWDAIAPAAPFWFGAACAVAAIGVLALAARTRLAPRQAPIG